MAKYDYNPSSNTDNAYHMVDFKGYDFEPQRQNNFELMIVGLKSLKSVDKGIDITNAEDNVRLACAGSGVPSFTTEVIKIPRGNTEVKFAGKATYDDTEVKFNDYIGIDTEKIISAWHGLTFNPRSQNIGPSSQYKLTGYLTEYSPDHKIYRQWQLVGCWLQKVNYGDFSSENSGVRQITGTLVYDYAIPLDE